MISERGYGVLPVAIENEYYLRASSGDFPNVSTFFKFGRSETVNTTETVIWDNGGNYTFLTASERLSVVSDSANDSVSGTGARTLIVYGQDENNEEIYELLTLNGTTPVVTTQSFLRHYRAFVVTCGTNTPAINSANAGTITTTGQTTGTVLSVITPNNGQTLMTPYTVPSGKTLFVTGMSASSEKGSSIFLTAKIRNGITSEHAFSTKYTLEIYRSTFTTELKTPMRIPEKTDICWTAISDSGSVNMSVSYGGLLIDN